MKVTRTNIDVGGVLHAGRELEVREAVSLSEFASFDFPAPVAVSLAIRRIGRGIALTGTIDGEARGECGRCLDEVALGVHVDVDERFEPSDRDDPLDESNILSGDELDLRDLVRQLIDSALPIVLACSDDCPGLCAACGQKRDGTCRCATPE